jgi:hypothetical protein
MANVEERKKQLEEQLKKAGLPDEQIKQELAKLDAQAKEMQQLQQLAEKIGKMQEALAMDDLQKALDALEMSKADSPEMSEVLQTQKGEANNEFFKYISKNYAQWLKPKATAAPIMSHTLLQFKVLPHLEKGTPLFFILIDNLRFDQWKAIQPIFAESFRIAEEDSFYSILPTATQYCRNAIFSGLLQNGYGASFIRFSA